MKCGPVAITLECVKRLPRGEALDRWVAAGLIVAAELACFVGDATPHIPRWLGALLAFAIPAGVAFRRRWPLAAGSWIVLLTSLIFTAGGNNYSIPLFIAWACGLYALAVWTETRAFIVGLGVLLGGNLLSAAGPTSKLSDSVFFTLVPGIAMVITRRAVRERQLLADSLAARAELLEREHEMREREALAEERARIARELHDLVAHNVSVMVVQAGVERHALPEGQESTRETLTAIEQAGRQAPGEARRPLRVLGPNGTGEGNEPHPATAPGGVLVEHL